MILSRLEHNPFKARINLIYVDVDIYFELKFIYLGPHGSLITEIGYYHEDKQTTIQKWVKGKDTILYF